MLLEIDNSQADSLGAMLRGRLGGSETLKEVTVTRMLIADSLTVPRVGLVVTGRPELEDIREGDLLWLNEGALRHRVTVRGVRHFCTRSIDPRVAPAGVNASLILDGVPEGMALPGLWLSSA
ncbi:hypothetical protein [Micromonospora sp. MA102]|uniref:hypothetical protein n=1 Tax=Micromonospora sp. MA102 TaxID=2952755 RepID=UPI0021C86035|nr:hypothetical protein [Micromonospora sp. MA102]